MRRALVVTPTPTHPADHGHRQRVHQMCAFLKASGLAIDIVLYPMDSDFDAAIPDAAAAMAAAWGGLCCVAPPSRTLHAAAAGLDHTLDEWWDGAMDAQLDWLCRRRDYDMLWVNYIFLSRAFRHAPPGCLKVLDTHDALAGRRARFSQAGLRAEFFHTDAATEAAALARADIVVAIKPSEAAHFSALGAPCVVTLPVAVAPVFSPPAQVGRAEPGGFADSQAPFGLGPAGGRGVRGLGVRGDPGCRVRPAPSRKEGAGEKIGPLRIGFIGADNQVNAAALETFLERWGAWRALWLPHAEIVVAGDVCRRVSPGGGVRLLGRVAEPASFYGAIDVVVAPILVSTGLKVKLAEALAWNMPFVATADACDGFAAADPFHALAGIDAVCEALLTLAAEPARLAALAAATARVAERLARDAASGEAALRDIFARRRLPIAFVTDIAVERRRTLAEERAWQMVSFLAALRPVIVVRLPSSGQLDAGALGAGVRATGAPVELPARASLVRCADGPAAGRALVEQTLAACVLSLAAPVECTPPSGVAVLRDDWPSRAVALVRRTSGGRRDGRDLVLDDGTSLGATPLRHLPARLAWTEPDARKGALLVLVEAATPEEAAASAPLVEALRRHAPHRMVVRRGARLATDPDLLDALARIGAPGAIATVGGDALSRELIASLACWAGAACFHLGGAFYPLLVGGRLIANPSAHAAWIGAWLRSDAPPGGSERAPDCGWSVLWRRLSQPASTDAAPG